MTDDRRLVSGPQAAPDSMLFLLAMLTFSAVIVGFVRALGHRYRQKPEVEDGIL